MPRYRVNTRSFIGEHLIEAGGEVEYDGVPGTNLDPLDAAAKKAVTKAEAERRKARGLPAKDDADGDDGFTVIRTGKDLESPFDPANPPPADGESRRGEHRPQEDRPAHPNPQANRPGDPQPEVGPTEDEVDGPKATEKAAKNATEARKNGPKDASDLA